jgi:hypothetical protein
MRDELCARRRRVRCSRCCQNDRNGTWQRRATLQLWRNGHRVRRDPVIGQQHRERGERTVARATEHTIGIAGRCVLVGVMVVGLGGGRRMHRTWRTVASPHWALRARCRFVTARRGCLVGMGAVRRAAIARHECRDCRALAECPDRGPHAHVATKESHLQPQYSLTRRSTPSAAARCPHRWHRERCPFLCAAVTALLHTASRSSASRWRL